MKKFLFFMALCVVALTAEAQENRHAVGLRAGGSAELLYEYYPSAGRHWQFTFGLTAYDGLALSGLHFWRLKSWDDWSPRTATWYLDAGAGAVAGMYPFGDAGFLIAATGSCSFGCRFRRTPLSLEVDYRPQIGALTGGRKEGFFKPGLLNFGLSLKYHF